MTKAINFVMAQNKMDTNQTKMLRDLVVCARGFLKVSFDANDDIVIRRVDVAQLIHSEVDQDDFTDAKYMGEYLFYTIDEVAQQSNGDLTEEQLFKIAQKAKGLYGNPDWNSQWGSTYYPNIAEGGRPWGRFKVKVLDVEYKSFDKIEYEKISAKGGGFYYQRVKGKPKKKAERVDEITMENIYKCTYIVDTDYCYNYGLKENQVVDRINGKPSLEKEFGYIGFAPDIYDMKNKSLVEQLIDDCDQITILKLHAQRLVSHLRSAGYAIDASQVAAMTNGLGNKNFNPRDYIDIYEQTGILVWNGTDEAGQQQRPPITVLPESTGQALMVVSDQIRQHYQSIETVTGVPMSTLTAPDKDSLIGLEKIAAQNRNNSLRYISDAYRNILSRTAKQVYLHVQDAISRGKIDEYINGIGEGATEVLKFTKDLTAMEFGIEIEVAPDIVEQAEFNELLKVGLQAGNLKESDVIALRKLGKQNLDVAQKYMQIWEDRYTAEKAELAQQAAMAQTQGQQQLAQTQAQLEQQKLLTEHNLKMREMKAEFLLKSNQSTQDHREKIDELLVQGDMKIEQIEAAMEGEGREEGGKKTKSNYESLGMPKASGVRLGSVKPSTKPTI
jgi:hypothetical protein